MYFPKQFSPYCLWSTETYIWQPHHLLVKLLLISVIEINILCFITWYPEHNSICAISLSKMYNLNLIVWKQMNPNWGAFCKTIGLDLSKMSKQVLAWVGSHWKPHTLPVGRKSNLDPMESSLAALPKIKLKISTWPSNPNLRYKPERIENNYPNQNMYTDVPSSTTIHSSQRVETAQIFISAWIRVQIASHPYRGHYSIIEPWEEMK